MTQHIAAGYIVTDNEVVHGIGPTADEAWADARRYLSESGISILSDDEDSSDQLGNWTRHSGLHIRSASAALLSAVRDCGGSVAWFMVGGTACTRSEVEDEG